jgi:hypothetical protein
MVTNKLLAYRPKPLATSKLVILSAVAGYYFSKYLQPFLLPWGPAEPQPWNERPLIPKVDRQNDLLTTKCKLKTDLVVLFCLGFE